MYQISYSKEALKMLKTLDKKTEKRIKAKIKLLANNPDDLKNNIEKLKNREGYRLRVGDYRVIFDIDKKILTICIINIKTRNEAYE
jgi:mRNA interferase RelE/StbE